jgi:hypothetical protein
MCHRPLFVAFVVTLSAVAAPLPAPKTSKAPDMYPLQLGNRWEFEAEIGGEKKSVVYTIDKIEKVDGKSLARMTGKLDGVAVASTEHLAVSESGVFRHRSDGVEADPPILLVPHPFKPGATWKSKTKVGAETWEITGSTGEPTEVETPAGKFKAFPVTLEVNQNGMNINSTYYFAENVGIVSQTMMVGDTTILRMQLKKFTRGDKPKR